MTQEIYFEFIPTGTYFISGIWKLYLRGRRIKEGNYNLWLPGVDVTAPVPGGGYSGMTGTSFAVPFIAESIYMHNTPDAAESNK